MQRRPLHGLPGDLDFHLEVMLNMNPQPSTTPEPPPGRRTSFAIVGLGDEKMKDYSNDLLFGNGGVLSSLLELNCGRFLGSTEDQVALLGFGQQDPNWVWRNIKDTLFEGNDILLSEPGEDSDLLKPCDLNSFWSRFKYFQEGEVENPEESVDAAVKLLNQQMQMHDAGQGVRVFYLALPQRRFPGWSEAIARQAKENPGVDVRVLLEPSFAHGALPASLLLGNQELYFADHYGDKHMMKAMTSFRQMNAFIDRIWNGQTFDRVCILDHLEHSVKDMGNYFTNVGQVRDRIASHLLQILALTAMELPSTMYDVAPGRLQVLESSKLKYNASSNDTFSFSKFGQYAGFLEEKGLTYDPDKAIPTYAKLEFEVDSPRWTTEAGAKTPFIIETGRGLGASFLEVRLEQGDEGTECCALVVRIEGLSREERSCTKCTYRGEPPRRIHVENPGECSFRYEMDKMLREGSLTKPEGSSLFQAEQTEGKQRSFLEKNSFLGQRAERRKAHLNLVEATSLGMGKGPHVVLKYDPQYYAPSAYARLFQAAFEGRRDEYVSGREMQRQLEILNLDAGHDMPPWERIQEYRPCTSEEAQRKAETKSGVKKESCPSFQAPMTDVLKSDLYKCEPEKAQERCVYDFYASKCPEVCGEVVGEDDPELVSDPFMDEVARDQRVFDGTWKAKNEASVEEQTQQVTAGVQHEAAMLSPGAFNPLIAGFQPSQDDDEAGLSKEEKRQRAADREELAERGRMSLLEAIQRRMPIVHDSESQRDVTADVNPEVYANTLIKEVKKEIDSGRKKHESATGIVQNVQDLLKEATRRW